MSFWLVTIGCLVLGLVSGCGVVAPRTPGLAQVGVVVPLGADPEQGQAVVGGAALAIDEWNRRGGAGGVGLTVAARDEGTTPAAGALRATQLASDPATVVALGFLHDPAWRGASPVFRGAGLAATGLRAGRYEAMAHLVLRAVPERAPLAAIIEAGGADEPVVAALEQLAPGRVTVERFVAGEGGAERLASLAVAQQPGSLFLGMSAAEAGRLARRLPPGQPRICGLQCSTPALLRAGGDAVAGWYLLFDGPFPDDDGPDGAGFATRFRQAARTEPQPLAWLAYASLNGWLRSTESGLGRLSLSRSAVYRVGTAGALPPPALYRMRGAAYPGDRVVSGG